MGTIMESTRPKPLKLTRAAIAASEDRDVLTRARERACTGRGFSMLLSSVSVIFLVVPVLTEAVWIKALALTAFGLVMVAGIGLLQLYLKMMHAIDDRLRTLPLPAEELRAIAQRIQERIEQRRKEDALDRIWLDQYRQYARLPPYHS